MSDIIKELPARGCYEMQRRAVWRESKKTNGEDDKEADTCRQEPHTAF